MTRRAGGRPALLGWLCPLPLLVLPIACMPADSARPAGQPRVLTDGWSYCWERAPSHCAARTAFTELSPERWPGQIPGRDGATVLWLYRAAPELPIAATSVGLYLPGVFLSLRVLQGEREVYRFAEDSEGALRFAGVPWHFVPLPPEAAGDLRLRISSTHPVFLGVRGSIVLLEREQLWRRMLLADLDNLAFAVLFGTVGLLAWSHAFSRRDSSLPALFSAGAAALAIGAAALTSTQSKQLLYPAPLFWNLLQFPLMYFFTVAITDFLVRVLPFATGAARLTLRWLRVLSRALLCWTLLAWPAFLFVIRGGWTGLYRAGYIWLPAALVGLILLLIGAAVLNLALRGSRQARIAAGGLTALLLARVYDMFGEQDYLQSGDAAIYYGMGGVLVAAGWILLDELRELRERAREAEREQFAARLREQRERMKPHFLFNSLNALYILAMKRPDEAAAGILNLAEAYRHILERGVENLVDFSDEWAFARQYLAAQSLRLNDRLEYDLRMTGDPAGHKIPPLSLQPVLENAIEHGLAPRAGGGKVIVRARFHHGANGSPRWWVLVRDNGVGCQRAVRSGPRRVTGAAYTGETLSNIRLRLEHLLEGGGLWIRPHVAGGTVVIFTGGPPRQPAEESAGAIWQGLS